MVVLEASHLKSFVTQLLPSNPVIQQTLLRSLGFGNQTLTQVMNSVRVEDYAMLYVVMWADRFKGYLQEQEGIDHDLVALTNSVAARIGIDLHVSVTLPIATVLRTLLYLRLFLDQLFIQVLTVIVILGMMLIYSLLIGDIEDKTYEYGMMRALGMKSSALIQHLIMQATYYSLPGITLGLLAAFSLNVPLSNLLADFAFFPRDYTLTSSAVAVGTLIGLFMPLVSTIVPIQRALSKTLRDSLDIYHQVSSETSVQMIKLESLGLDPWQVGISLAMVVISFFTYYLIPLAFVFNNFTLLFTVLTVILLGMLTGAAAMMTVFQPWVELGALKLLVFWGPDRNLENLIQKSLSGHRYT